MFGIFKSKSRRDDPTAELLRRLSIPCVSCGSKKIDGHHYGRLACIIADGNSREIERVLGLVRNHDWTGLAGLQDFDADKNAVVVYAIFCGQAGSILVLRDTVDVHEPESLLAEEAFAEEEADSIRSLLVFEKQM